MGTKINEKYVEPENQLIIGDYLVGQFYATKQWYIRPLDWAGIWERVDNKIYLVDGNVEKTFDSKNECLDYLTKKIKGEE